MISVGIKPLLERLNAFCRTGLESAAGSCVARSHYEITVEHVLWQLIDHPKSDLALILAHFGIPADTARSSISRVLEDFSTGNSAKPVFSPRLIEWFQEALLIGTVELGEEFVRSGALVLAFLSKGDQLGTPETNALFNAIDKDELLQQFGTVISGSIEKRAVGKTLSSAAPRGGSALEKYCEDFTEKARRGKIDPVFGRDPEIRQVVDIFARRRKNNPIVVGEAGVGKTAIVEGLALRIIEGDVPDFLKNVSLLGLDMGLLQAGAGMKGEFEKRLQQVIEEVKASEKPIILFIDEAHTLIGAGGRAGGSDAANLLKPALARGELRTVAATTWSEYKKYFEKDAALARRFQLVHLEEPSEETAVLILRGLKDKYEHAHGVIIRDDAVKAAAEMSHRYISGRYLPDKAIDLLDTSAARVKVLMTGKPDAVESVERKLQATEREKTALERDDVYGNHDENDRLAEIADELEALEMERVEITERWEKEQQLVASLMDARENLFILKSDRLVESDGSDRSMLEDEALESVEEVPVESEEELLKRIEELQRELEALQSDGALVQSEVGPEIVSQVVSDWTGIPAGKMMHDEAGDMIKLEENLKERVKGQDAALADLCEIIKASKAGLKDPCQPLGVFLLTGPSGVGKTETGLAIAELLFGGERFAVSINMSEFQEKHTVSRLIGSPPGYVGYGEGGVLTEAVRQRPYSVVLLDECEKADTDVMNLFYQVFDKGMLSDGEGRNINFRNTVILLTSNLASEQITQLRAQNPDISNDELTAAIRPILSDHFKPALLARMSIVPFASLDEKTMRKIVHLKMKKVVGRMKDAHNVKLIISDAVEDAIADRCLEVETGARNIDHIMNGTILPLLSQEILQRMSEGELPPELSLDVSEEGMFEVTE